ncbi:PREDICTED: jacalin-related lectin 3-like [Nelumbo nucifera]|uniref:Jacalin-related lectin 3-like n=1 Tax=Nelumbo nucifera TaxID=4432 RepID=A0A1U8AIA0_NELNU|nr:PREDICTED: jacalin-related lectin 3-like [Nelumbo nucifera]
MMELNGNIISDGPWGGRGGGEWDDGSHSTVKRLIISHGWVIDSIEVEYGDDEGRSVSHGRHGGGGGTRSEIDLDYPDEFITAIHVTYGTFVWLPVVKAVHTLEIETNRRRYGPFGFGTGRRSFTYRAANGMIVGFHGTSGSFLNSIGVHVRPLH